MKLTLALAALAALASSTSALPPFPKPPVPGNPACLAHIGTLRNGACGPIAKKVTKETAVAIAGASCAELEAMTITADASDACCADAVKFVQDGCGCDPGILSLISAANADADTLSGAVRLAQTSHCAAAGPSGWVNPCPGASSCLTPVKTAAVAAPKVAG